MFKVLQRHLLQQWLSRLCRRNPLYRNEPARGVLSKSNRIPSLHRWGRVLALQRPTSKLCRRHEQNSKRVETSITAAGNRITATPNSNANASPTDLLATTWTTTIIALLTSSTANRSLHESDWKYEIALFKSTLALVLRWIFTWRITHSKSHQPFANKSKRSSYGGRNDEGGGALRSKYLNLVQS